MVRVLVGCQVEDKTSEREQQVIFLVKQNIDGDAAESAERYCTTNSDLYVVHGKQARGNAGIHSVDKGNSNLARMTW